MYQGGRGPMEGLTSGNILTSPLGHDTGGILDTCQSDAGTIRGQGGRKGSAAKILASGQPYRGNKVDLTPASLPYFE